jgi:holo-[acyl-carrier protein] synthase
VIFGIGIDTIEVERIARAIETYGDQFVKRIYSDDEIAYCKNRPHTAEHFAARFAAKEAYAKAIGTGVRKYFIWKEVSVARHSYGRPYIVLSERMQEVARRITKSEIAIQLSLTHTKNVAEAIVTIERSDLGA